MQGYPPGPGGRGPRNGLGAVTFVVVLLGALLAVIPASAVWGLLLCLVAIVPAIVAVRRTRRGVATNRRRSVAALTLAPAFVVVAVCVAATAPPTTGMVGQAVDRAGAGPVALVPAAPQGVAPAAPPGPGAPQAASGQAAGQAAPGEAAGQAAPGQAAPRRAAPPRPVPLPAATPRAPVARQAAAPAVKPAPAKPPVKPAPAKLAPACDEATHYVNSIGNCVLRPVVAAAAPAGASAQCKDGTYSSSQHRSGTCSSHGGVQRWLKSLPA